MPLFDDSSGLNVRLNDYSLKIVHFSVFRVSELMLQLLRLNFLEYFAFMNYDDAFSCGRKVINVKLKTPET